MNVLSIPAITVTEDGCSGGNDIITYSKQPSINIYTGGSCTVIPNPTVSVTPSPTLSPTYETGS